MLKRVWLFAKIVCDVNFVVCIITKLDSLSGLSCLFLLLFYRKVSEGCNCEKSYVYAFGRGINLGGDYAGLGGQSN